MDIASLLISLISGVAGGNAAGAAMPEKNMGAVANSVSGLIGGGLGDFLLRALGVLASAGAAGAAGATGATGSELDIASILGNVLGSGVSGAVLTTIITLIKSALQKS